MDSPKVAYERIDGFEHVIRIPLASIRDSRFVFDVLKDTFEACFKNGESKFVVDLEDIQLPSSSLIALLVEMTSRARRLNGDVKILNLSNKTLAHLNTFSARNYLSLEQDETAALQEFDQTPTENRAAPGETVESGTTSGMGSLTPTGASKGNAALAPPLSGVDIVEDPLIEKLHDRVDRPTVIPKEAEPEAEGVDTSKGERNHLRVKSVTSNLYSICDFVTSYAERAGLSLKDVGKTKIAVYEACLNVIEHAYHSHPDNWIDVWIEYNSEMFKIIIQDYGAGFEGFSDKQYDVLSAMDGRQTGGFGLYIIRRSMDQLDYRPDPKRGNRLTMIRFLQ
ncbi:MAG: ATP-binding protein [bacterium]